MANYLGKVSLRSKDNSDVFYEAPVFAAPLTEEMQLSMMESEEWLTGFDSDGQSIAFEQYVGSHAMVPFQIEKGNEEIQITYRDGSTTDIKYELTVFLVVEEAPIAL